jgi:hypothetical protein
VTDLPTCRLADGGVLGAVERGIAVEGVKGVKAVELLRDREEQHLHVYVHVHRMGR